MTDRRWLNTEPGVLVLIDTDWRVEYQSQGQDQFAVFQGRRLKWRVGSLHYAKERAEAGQMELEEMGIG